MVEETEADTTVEEVVKKQVVPAEVVTRTLHYVVL
jgi:hypothetical protein